MNAKASGNQFRTVFFNEAYTAWRLTHLYIIGIYDVSVDEGAYCIVVAYIRDGKTHKLFTKADALVPIEKVI
ncbi:MAG: serine/threonine-protein kinase, partial [Gammaproteobacteria bacterium]